MDVKKARKKLLKSNDAFETVLYRLSIDVEKLKEDVKWIKWLIEFILASLLTLLAKSFIFS